MGILNAIFAPLVVLYFLMYSFFKYFEVRASVVSLSMPIHIPELAAIPQRPVHHWRSAIYPLRPMEIQGIQRTPPYIYPPTGRKLSSS